MSNTQKGLPFVHWELEKRSKAHRLNLSSPSKNFNINMKIGRGASDCIKLDTYIRQEAVFPDSGN